MYVDPPHPAAPSGEVKVTYSGPWIHNPNGKSVTVFMQEDKWGIKRFKLIDLTVHAHKISSHTHAHSLAYWYIWHRHMWVHMLFIWGHREQTGWNNPQWQRRERDHTHLTTARQMSSAFQLQSCSLHPETHIHTLTCAGNETRAHRTCQFWKFVESIKVKNDYEIYSLMVEIL